MMVDDTSLQGKADRNQVAAGEGYEIGFFAKKHGITRAVARDLIAEVGNDREKLDAAASALPKAAPRSSPRSNPPSRETPARSRARSTAAPARRSRTKQTAIAAISQADEADTFISEPLTVSVRAVRSAAHAATEPLSEAITSGVGVASDRAKTAMAAASRSATGVRRRISKAPSAVTRQASKTLEAAKSAATSRTATLIGAAAAGVVAGLAVNLGRKAVVQAPSVMAGDWFEALKTEHALALGIFDAIEQTSDVEPAKRAVLLTQLKHALGKHAFTEENVVYPALRDWGDKADADKLNHDHGYVKQYLYELDAIDNSSPAFLARIAAFRADLEAHIREEEDAIFPPLHAALGAAKNAEITALTNKEGFKLA